MWRYCCDLSSGDVAWADMAAMVKRIECAELVNVERKEKR